MVRRQKRGAAMSTTDTIDLGTIFEQYHRRIERHIRAMTHDPVEAEDLVQETFLRAERGLEGLRDPDAAVAWLYRVATNVCLDRLRAASRRVVEPLGASEPAVEDPSEPRLDVLMERQEMSACVREFLDTLPDDYRAAIILHDLHGLTVPEIARVVGCSPATAKIRIHRGRQRLRQTMNEWCELSRDARGSVVCERRGPTEGTAA